MSIKTGLKNIFNSVVGNLAVIGPYDDDLTVEALLAGRKPLAWLYVPSASEDSYKNDPERRAEYLHECRNIQRLDEAVKQGKLKSTDVVVHRCRVNYDDLDSGFKECPPSIMRHYCQPDKEEDMNLFVALNEKAFNFYDADFSLLKKDEGAYLGYRDKDIQLWQKGLRTPLRQAESFVEHHIHSKACREKMVQGIMKLSDLINGPIQKAYRGKVMHQIEVAQKKLQKINRSSVNPPPQPVRASFCQLKV